MTDAFSEALHDASDEVSTYASRAAETLARFRAAQFAMQFNPIESGLSMKPTYVKVPAQTVEELKFWENEDLRALKTKHLEEKQQILAENAGMRALLGDEDFSEAIQGLRETEDGVNRALLLAAVEEITNLKTRVSVLETEAAKQKVSSSGYGGITSMLGGGGSGVDAAQMQKLTRELARLEENNSRMTWMLGEKEKQIKEVRAKYTESAAYALQEKLQECMEVLEVASNLQGEQLQYLEQHALSKLELLDDQIADIQVLAESKTEHLAQLRTIMKRFFVDGDEGSVDVLTSLTGFPADEGRKLVQARQSRSLTGFLTMIGAKLTPAVNAGVTRRIIHDRRVRAADFKRDDFGRRPENARRRRRRRERRATDDAAGAPGDLRAGAADERSRSRRAESRTRTTPPVARGEKEINRFRRL